MKLTTGSAINLLETTFKQKKGSIKLNTPLEKFAHDSMDVMEFIAILKHKHNIQINAEEIVKLKTVKDITDYIVTHQDESFK